MGSSRPEVAVIGLGRFGQSLATELVRRGVDVLAIDRDQDLVQSLARELTLVVTADSTDLEALRQLKVDRCQQVFVTIGNNLEASILTVLHLTDLAIPAITAKAQDALSAEVLLRVGAHRIISPESERGGQVATTVAHELSRT
ncbi:MAG: TrkA family potassium uptake protein [Dermatophilaceae bacterium]